MRGLSRAVCEVLACGAVVVAAAIAVAPSAAGASTSRVAAPMSCVAPTIEVAPASGPPGTEVVVTGQNFFDGCNDTVQCSPSGCEPWTPMPPTESVVLTFVQGEQTWPLTTAHPDQTYRFTETVTVPPDAAPGAAFVRANGFEATFDVSARPPLARTGVPSGTMVGVGVLLAASGVMLLRLRTRRLRHT